MKLAIMQPYFFPYIGYFQLINAVDAFVVYDDVNYINRGWINRNNLLADGKSELITLETSGASQNKLINEIGIGENRKKLLKNISQKYSRAPCFEDVFPVIENVMLSGEKNLARFLENSLRVVCKYLGISKQWYRSSEVRKNNALRGQDKIIDICHGLNATHYINPAGGKDLYERKRFLDEGIRLSFIEMRPISYPQFGKDFVPCLSIIDVMMFNDKKQCSDLLEEYSLD